MSVAYDDIEAIERCIFGINSSYANRTKKIKNNANIDRYMHFKN